jgi:EAL domain-containing protein (putative c-di-GMP-specific phosphodiesterase class I)
MAQTDLSALGISRVEINLSVAQCLQRELPERIRELQEKYRIDPRQVNFEVTETLFDNLGGIMDKNLRTLSDMGYTFSLDDYGVGYSNIQRLRALPLDIIKIDKSMVDDMFTMDGEVIIENTVRMMKGIRKELVVEGVETEKEAKACEDLSCDYIQGFYYARPLPAEEFVRFLREHNKAAPPEVGKT